MTLPSQTVEDPAAQRNFDHINAFGVPIPVFDHVPTDLDFNRPPNGILAIYDNGVTPALYARVRDGWVTI